MRERDLPPQSSHRRFKGVASSTVRPEGIGAKAAAFGRSAARVCEGCDEEEAKPVTDGVGQFSTGRDT